MPQEPRREWLALYHEGDSRLQNKRHGIFRLNKKNSRIEFAVQTSESDSSPVVVVNYPLRLLKSVDIVEKRQRMKKKEYIQLTMGEPPNEMFPLFSFSIDDLGSIKAEIERFKLQSQVQDIQKEEKDEGDVLDMFAKLLMTPIEQFQHLIEDMTSRIISITKKPTKVTQTFFSGLEPKSSYQTRQIKLKDRIFTYFESPKIFPRVLLFLSPLGGKIEDYYSLIPYLQGSYQIMILGIRGHVPPFEQDLEYKLKDFVQDLRDFIDFLGPDRQIILTAHSLISAVILDEFLKDNYSNIEKIILLSGIHRPPDTFKKGIKALPPIITWGPFKTHVKKLAPKVLFDKKTDDDLKKPYINHAFEISDKVYYEIFKDFLSKYDYSDNIAILKKPMLIVWGLNDHIITTDLKKEMKDNLLSSNLSLREIPGGHMLFLDSPRELSKEINEFIFGKRSSIEIE
ncbi:MAG: alpha/beta hydrolase [Candidatus Heimdallarchaeota archaeon]|nr:alpha/beta hydrolase [Candidatus Heimdallarchaeota archaeon]